MSKIDESKSGKETKKAQSMEVSSGTAMLLLSPGAKRMELLLVVVQEEREGTVVAIDGEVFGGEQTKAPPTTQPKTRSDGEKGKR